MARVLIIYHRSPLAQWLPTYVHSLDHLRQYPDHVCLSWNAARPSVPKLVAAFDPDLVVFHYTCLPSLVPPETFAETTRSVEFVKELGCKKVIVAQDEQVRSDLVSSFIRDFGISHVFSPAPPQEWPRIYAGVDFNRVSFHRILTGYVDESTARRVARRAKRHRGRPTDIGYRTWYMQPFYGRHGQLKRRIAEAFEERAPQFGLSVDISTDVKDALWGDRWFDFLLDCKYTIGVEGGSSVFDRDGAVAQRTHEYLSAHDEASFEDVETACFPGLDGQFGYRLLSPRHLEAVMTRTCQILVEGEYGGVLEPGKHFIELKRDFGNLDEVLEVAKRDQLRAGIVERAYEKVVTSGMFSFTAFADLVFRESLAEPPASRRTHALVRLSPRALWNRLDEASWLWASEARQRMLHRFRPLISSILGEQRLRRLLARVRSFARSSDDSPE